MIPTEQEIKRTIISLDHKNGVLKLENENLKETIRKRNLLIKQLRKDIKYWSENANNELVENEKLATAYQDVLRRTKIQEETIEKMLKEQGKIVD